MTSVNLKDVCAVSLIGTAAALFALNAKDANKDAFWDAADTALNAASIAAPVAGSVVFIAYRTGSQRERDQALGATVTFGGAITVTAGALAGFSRLAWDILSA